MALAVLIKGIDGFGGELWTTDAFWWDAATLTKFLGDRLKLDESWNEGAARISRDEMTKLMEMFPVLYAQQQHHFKELAARVESTDDFKVIVYEWSSE